MEIRSFGKAECSVYTMQEVADKGVEKILMEAFCGCAFVVNLQNIYLFDWTIYGNRAFCS